MRTLPKDMPSSAEWLPVVGFEELYEISRWGQVYSIRHDKMRKGAIDSKGYIRVTFWSKGVSCTKQIHRVVMEAFVGPCPKGYQVNHRDSNPSNNCVENIEYITGSENCRHAYRDGRNCRKGESHNQAKFTDNAIRDIRDRCRAGERQKDVAVEYGVDASTISYIARKKRWQHVI